MKRPPLRTAPMRRESGSTLHLRGRGRPNHIPSGLGRDGPKSRPSPPSVTFWQAARKKREPPSEVPVGLRYDVRIGGLKPAARPPAKRLLAAVSTKVNHEGNPISPPRGRTGGVDPARTTRMKLNQLYEGVFSRHHCGHIVGSSGHAWTPNHCVTTGPSMTDKAAPLRRPRARGVLGSPSTPLS